MALLPAGQRAAFPTARSRGRHRVAEGCWKRQRPGTTERRRGQCATLPAGEAKRVWTRSRSRRRGEHLLCEQGWTYYTVDSVVICDEKRRERVHPGVERTGPIRD